METSLGGFLTFRGFADFAEIARASEPDKAYQRDIDEKHNKELQDFLEKGENLFFPELVLGCYLPEDETEIERLNEFFSAFHRDEKGNFGFKKFNIGIQAPKSYGNSTFKIATLSTLKERSDENIFFRIDGNHRITAFENLQKQSLNEVKVSVCIIFFRTKEEYNKQSKMIFHNLNFKAAHLSKEKSLELIFGDEENFPNRVLEDEESFGLSYLHAKEASQLEFKKYFTHIDNVFKNDIRSTFLEFFIYCKDQEKSIDAQDIRESLSFVNEIYKESHILKESKNTTLLSAFIFYTLECGKNNKCGSKIKLFQKWVLKNHIYKAKLDLESLIEIFDNVYNSRIKKVFVAMAFKEEGCNDVWETIKRVYNKLIKDDNFILDNTEQDENGFIPYRVDQVDEFNNDIIKKIEDGIKDCCLMIVDITHNRPNVYYELGLAKAQEKPIIIISRDSCKPHFDIFNLDRVIYSSCSQLENELYEKVKQLLEKEIVSPDLRHIR